METIAITCWNEILSPLYDASCCLLIIRPDGSRTLVDVRNLSLFDKAELCVKEGVTVLICGAQSNVGKAMLVNRNITVFSWIRGSIDDVIGTYQQNGTLPEKFFMPGCGRMMCRKKRQFGHHGGM